MPFPTGRAIARLRRTSGSCRSCTVLATAAILALCWIGANEANGLVRFDFEQKYLVHPDRQVWDFSLIRADSTYHAYYHTIHMDTPSAARGDTIWHASSPDLKHWSIVGPVVTAGSGPWDAGAVWAPDVARDERGEGWIMAYTGCDAAMNQRICFASSDDLYDWTPWSQNPIIEPDTTVYAWSASQTWSNFRDPFLYFEDNRWQVLVTASQLLDGQLTGVLYHGVSEDLIDWADAGPVFVNDGADPWRVLESCQRKIRGQTRHLLFGEFDTVGISLISAPLDSAWTMDDRVILDPGYAPEVEQFDPGHDILGRLAPFAIPLTGQIGYVARFDTLHSEPDGSGLEVYKPDPLAENWESWSGLSNLGNPTFGDNSAVRGDESCGLVGNGYYGSAEYYRGPLSGRGAPGTTLGDGATGTLTSKPFAISGDRMDLLVGGGSYPATCYVALVRQADGVVLFSETGNGQEEMTLRQWDLRSYRGQTVQVVIVDAETGPFGRINVDEILEKTGTPAATGPAPTGSTELIHGATPNPCNPRTVIHFDLERPATARIMIHDLRGRLVWSSPAWPRPAGPQSVAWTGRTRSGSPAPAGTYLYVVELDGRRSASGKLSLVK